MTSPRDTLLDPPPAVGAPARLPVPLPAVQRPAALSVLDISEYVGAASGGVRTYLREKARYVGGRDGLRQVLVIPGGRDGLTESDGVRCYQLRGPAIPFHSSYRFLLATRSVRRIVAHERPDLIEIGSAYGAPWVVAHARAPRHVPVVWFYHSNLPRLVAPALDVAGARRDLRVRTVARYVAAIGRRVTATFAASDAAARDLAEYGVPRIERVTLGVDTERFTDARRAQAAAVRRRHGLGDRPLVGCIGRWAPEKRIDVLLRAWPWIAHRADATLVLLGHGPEEGRLRALARGYDVRFLPYLADRDAMADLLAAMDLVVSPAPHETFGLGVCEALASGVPVLSADRGAAAELVTRSGGGALFAAGEPEDLAARALALLHGDRAALGGAARRHVVEHHAWPVALDALFATYRRLLGR